MTQETRNERGQAILSAIEQAYSLGVSAVQFVNRRGRSSEAFNKRERESLDRLMKILGADPLTDAEYEGKFNR